MANHLCPTCKGDGYVSKLGAFTSEDLDREYGQGMERDEFIQEYTRRGGIYDKVCPTCKGEKVLTDEQLEEWHEGEEDRAIWENLEARAQMSGAIHNA